MEIKKGFICDKPRENAPSFVKGRISFHYETFIAFLQANKNEKGWTNFDLLEGKDGSYYIKLNDYKPKEKVEQHLNYDIQRTAQENTNNAIENFTPGEPNIPLENIPF